MKPGLKSRLPATQKLPVWRLVAALAVLGVMIAILATLAPVYFEDYQLRRYVIGLAHSPGAATMPDETLRTQVLDEARKLDLPVEPNDVSITHPQSGRLELQIKYAVQMDFPLYQVDLHFHPNASSR